MRYVSQRMLPFQEIEAVQPQDMLLTALNLGFQRVSSVQSLIVPQI